MKYLIIALLLVVSVVDAASYRSSGKTSSFVKGAVVGGVVGYAIGNNHSTTVVNNQSDTHTSSYYDGKELYAAPYRCDEREFPNTVTLRCLSTGDDYDEKPSNCLVMNGHREDDILSPAQFAAYNNFKYIHASCKKGYNKYQYLLVSGYNTVGELDFSNEEDTPDKCLNKDKSKMVIKCVSLENGLCLLGNEYVTPNLYAGKYGFNVIHNTCKSRLYLHMVVERK
jgi:hypothetical protein